jgi:hypothetical protein
MGTDVYPTVSQSTSVQAFDEVIAKLIKQHIFPPLLSMSLHERTLMDALFQISIKLLLMHLILLSIALWMPVTSQFSSLLKEMQSKGVCVIL